MNYIRAFDGNHIRIDASLMRSHITGDEISALTGKLNDAARLLQSKTGAGADFLGWLDPSAMNPPGELARLHDAASKLRRDTDTLVVIGIGGSYLGSRACYEALRPPDARYPLKFAGINMSAHYLTDLMTSLGDSRFGINVISKSGTTTEPSIAFRLLRIALEKRGADARRLIVATTDAAKGALRELADAEGWESFIVPDDVGGRFSVLTPVGLFPLAYAGIDIDALLDGATDCARACAESGIESNPAMFYAAIRHIMFAKKIPIELLAAFEPRIEQFIEWWKQLAGESDGKQHSGLFPAGASFSRDLHSLGQWIQDGPRILFETFLSIDEGESALAIPEMKGTDADDGLSYLARRRIADINKTAEDATRMAHADGGCPNLAIHIPKLDAYHLGWLIYFFEYSIALTGYLAGTNPFDQPGVEVYKRNMFALLGKPGFEEEGAKLRGRMDAG